MYGGDVNITYSVLMIVLNHESKQEGLNVTAAIKSSFTKVSVVCRMVAPGLPLVRLNSFDVIPGAHPGQPPVPCLWSGSLGGDLRCMASPREGECDRFISSCRGLTRVSTAGNTQGR